MHFAPPPQYISEMYKPAQPPAKTPPNLQHSFENPNAFSTVAPAVQPQPISAPVQPPTPTVGYNPYGAAVPGGAMYGSGGVAAPLPQQPLYPQPQPQPSYQQPLSPEYAPTQFYAPAPQPPQPQSYAQLQPQSYAQPQPQSYAPPQPFPSQPPQTTNPDVIALCPVQLGKSSDRCKFLDHPSIPRLLPQDVEDDLDVRGRALDYMNPVRRVSVRPTFDTFPATQTLADSLQLPLGINLRPFAERTLPEVDFAEVDNRMVRCRKCAAYINPYTTFCDGGRRWQCILCRQLNETSKGYYCPLDVQTGLRQDIMSRPELLNCSVDFLPTAEFLRRPPRRPIELVMLDCSFPSVSSGLLAAMCKGALVALEQMKDDDAMYMGVVGFDSTVYFFNLRSTLSAPRMMAAPDTVGDICNVNDNFKLEPVELPCPLTDLIVAVKDSYHLLRELFEKLPALLANTKEVGCAFGPALAAAITMLENNGGKIITSISALPSVGEGKLKHRFDMAKLSNQPKEYTVCAAAGDWYKQRALACSNSSISIDIIANGQSDLDLTTIAPLARYTSGKVYRATPLTMGGVAEEMERALLRVVAFDCILRVRTSTGLIVPNFYGHCHVREPDLLALPVADEDASYSVEFKMGPNVKNSFAYVQFALVYTTRTRERRIRVHTMQIPLVSSLAQVVNSANSIGMSCFLTKMCVDFAVNGPFAQAQQKITDKLVAALKKVKQHAEAQGRRAMPNELLLPESMKYVPQIINGFFRCSATGLATTRVIPADERVATMAVVMSSPPESLLAFYLGWSYQVFSPYTAVDQLPAPIYSSQSLFTSDGVFLVNIGTTLVLWCGKKTNPVIVRAFGMQPADSSADAEANLLAATPEQVEQLRLRTDALVAEQKLLCLGAFSAALELCPQGNGTFEPFLTRAMSEDDVRQIPSYGSYLQTILQRVNTEKSKA